VAATGLSGARFVEVRRRSVSAVVLSLALLLAACDDGGPALSPEEIVEAFIELSQAPERTVHIDVRGSLRLGGMMGGGEGMSFEAAIDCSGDDCSGSAQMAGDWLGPNMRMDVVVVGGQAFVRLSGSAWERSFEPARSLDPLRGLRPGDVEYAGVEESEIGPLHQLTVRNTRALLANGLGVTIGGFFGPAWDGSEPMVELFVDRSGRPVVLTMSVDTGEMGFGGQVLTHYEYSQWGAEIEILPPF
jgi:hypothetical protein